MNSRNLNPSFRGGAFALLAAASLLASSPAARAQTPQSASRPAAATTLPAPVSAPGLPGNPPAGEPAALSEFQGAKAAFPNFRVESLEEFRRIKEYHQQLLNEGTIRHRFKTAKGQLIHCISISSQPALKRAGIAPNSLKFAPEIPPRGDSPTAQPGLNPADFGLDGSLDDDGNARRCPPGCIPVWIPSLEDLCRFRKLEERFRKYPSGTNPAAGTTATTTTITTNQPQGQTAPPGPANLEPPSGHEYAYAYTWVDHQGERADFSVWQPAVERTTEFSLAQFWVVRGTDAARQTVEAGWQVYNQLYGDWQPHLFIYSTTNNYNSGAYNLGGGYFVQTDPSVVIGGAWSPVSTVGGSQQQLTLMFFRDQGGSHNWWLRVGGTWVGYYPNSLYNSTGLASKAERISYGGEIVNDNLGGVHTTTDMGSGRFPNEGWQNSAFIKRIQYVDMTGNYQNAGSLVPSATDSTYYDLALHSSTDTNWLTYFYFGGPGRVGAVNDLCSGAVALSDNVYYPQNTAEATDETGLPCLDTVSKGVWFTFTPALTGTATVDTCPSSFDTRLVVLSGACGALSSIVCNRDNGPACTGTRASASFYCTAGTTYYICAGGHSGGYGDLQIRAHVTQPDLAKSTDALNPSTVHPGDTLAPTITLQNQPCAGGNAPAPAFHVGFYWATDKNFTGVTSFYEAPVSGCAAGATTSLNPTFTINTNTLPGTYYLGYKLDDQREVPECTETNNGMFYWTITVLPPLPLKAINPRPANGSTGQPLSATLAWANGGGATSYDVYFNGQFQGNQTGTSFNPGLLAYSTTYSWRIDAKSAGGTATGDAWSFATVAPQLNAVHQGTNILFSWPANATGFSLEFATNLPSTNWLPVSPSPAVVNGQYTLTNAASGRSKFYRLRQ